MLYQCSGYSRLVCGGCYHTGEHSVNNACDRVLFCPTIQDNVHCDPVEEEGV